MDGQESDEDYEDGSRKRVKYSEDFKAKLISKFPGIKTIGVFIKIDLNNDVIIASAEQMEHWKSVFTFE